MFGVFFQFVISHIVYLALHLESSSFPQPLTPMQEIEAFEALRNGDLKARETIIEHNLRLVAHIAKKYYAAPGDSEDLISIGTMGLIKAVNTFDSTKRARFSTYASKCIENEIRMNFRRLKKEPDTVSMQESIEAGAGSGNLTVLDIVADDFSMTDSFESKERNKQLHRLVESLNGRERQVIILRYGLAGQDPLTQQEIADLLCISRSYVSRIEKHAVEQLRHAFRQEGSL